MAILLRERHAQKKMLQMQKSSRTGSCTWILRLELGNFDQLLFLHLIAGYSDDALNAFFEQVHVAVMGACREGRKTILGGDFNLQLQVGNRGAQITALANAFGLIITYDYEHHSPSAEKWTFSSSMGVKRRIAFIVFFLFAAACNITNFMCAGPWFGSYGCIRKVSAWKVGKKKVGTARRTNRGWTPKLDETGKPPLYHQLLSRSLQTPPDNLNALESVCKHAASKTSGKPKANTMQQMFRDKYFQSLLAERRATTWRHRRAYNSDELRALVEETPANGLLDIKPFHKCGVASRFERNATKQMR